MARYRAGRILMGKDGSCSARRTVSVATPLFLSSEHMLRSSDSSKTGSSEKQHLTDVIAPLHHNQRDLLCTRGSGWLAMESRLLRGSISPMLSSPSPSRPQRIYSDWDHMCCFLRPGTLCWLWGFRYSHDTWHTPHITHHTKHITQFHITHHTSHTCTHMQ